MRAHAREGGEEEQDEADPQGRRPHLLRREGPGIGVGERPHGERRGRLNAHKREHVGQAHDAGPQAAHRRLLAEARRELDHPGNREVGVVVAASVPLGGPPLADVRGGQLGQTLLQGIPSAGVAERDRAVDDDARGQQDALQGVHVGNRPQATRRHVNEHDDRQDPHADVLGEHAVGEGIRHRDDVEEVPGRAQLHAEIGDRVQQRHDHRQDADEVTLEVGAQHLARRHEPEAFAQHPLALQEDHSGERDGDRVERRVGVLEPVAVHQTRVTHEGPARERRCRRRQHEHPH